MILPEIESCIDSSDSDKAVDPFHGMWKSFQLIIYYSILGRIDQVM